MKTGMLTQDIENSYLTLDHLDPNPLQQVHGHSITYRVAVGPQQGKKVFTLQTRLPTQEDDRFSQVDKQRDELITQIEGKLNQQVQAEQLFSLRWRLD